MSLQVEKTMHTQWLSNSWLVWDRAERAAVLVDSGGPPEPLLERISAEDLRLHYVLCTHHHMDHVVNNARYRRACGAEVVAHPEEVSLFSEAVDRTLSHEEELSAGALRIRGLWIPGHTRGQLGYVINEERVFTGDTLFRGSVGGTRGPGHTTFEDLRSSILDTLMTLPSDWPVHPGHTEATTVAREWEENPFIRLWRGLEAPRESDCQALGEPATLMLRAADYDGGTKCLVRFAGGEMAIVAGSRVVDAP